MNGAEPLHGQWNFDHDNRKKIPLQHRPPEPLLMDHNLNNILEEITAAQLPSLGKVEAQHFSWPINRKDGLDILEYFAKDYQ